MKIIEINGHTARCDRMGLQREVDIYLLSEQQINIGDYVLVHVGYAIQKLALDDAKQRLELFSQLNEMDQSYA